MSHTLQIRLLKLLARVVSTLPLGLNRSLGSAIGRMTWVLKASPRRITECNLKLCFPDMPEAERQTLAYKSLLETGRQLTESAWIWHRPVEQTLKHIVRVEGQHLFDQARQSGKGVLVVSPHIGNWELCSLPLSRDEPFTYFYRSSRQAGLSELLETWRAHLGGQPATLDAAGIKKGLKVLKTGGILGILPDQEPDISGGVFAPFFDSPALTMTLLPKLARRSGAVVLFCVAKRLPGAKGWHIHFLPSAPAIASQDMDLATAAVNKGVEQCIALCPEQYLWDYKRLATLPDGSRRRYR